MVCRGFKKIKKNPQFCGLNYPFKILNQNPVGALKNPKNPRLVVRWVLDKKLFNKPKIFLWSVVPLKIHILFSVKEKSSKNLSLVVLEKNPQKIHISLWSVRSLEISLKKHIFWLFMTEKFFLVL